MFQLYLFIHLHQPAICFKKNQPTRAAQRRRRARPGTEALSSLPPHRFCGSEYKGLQREPRYFIKIRVDPTRPRTMGVRAAHQPFFRLNILFFNIFYTCVKFFQISRAERRTATAAIATLFRVFQPLLAIPPSRNHGARARKRERCQALAEIKTCHLPLSQSNTRSSRASPARSAPFPPSGAPHHHRPPRCCRLLIITITPR